MRAASLPTPPRYPAHASPALTEACSSSSSRAMTRCPSSAGRGRSTSMAFCVAQTLLAFLRDMREPERFGFQGMHLQHGCGRWHCQVVCRNMWCCASVECRGSECVVTTVGEASGVTEISCLVFPQTSIQKVHSNGTGEKNHSRK